MFVPAPQPADLPVTESGAERYLGLKAKEPGFELHGILPLSHESLLWQAQSSCFAVDLLKKSAITLKSAHEARCIATCSHPRAEDWIRPGRSDARLYQLTGVANGEGEPPVKR